MNTLLLRHIVWISAGLTACSVVVSGCSSKSSDNTGAGGAAGFGGYPMGGLGTGGATTAVVGMGGAVAAGGTPVGASGGVPPATGGVTAAGGTPVGGGAGMAGATAVGGTTGTGGTTVSVGGQSNASDIKIVGSTTLCAGATPMIPNTPVSSCSSMTCTGA